MHSGTDDRGQQFHWNSRRHRKGRLPAHKIHPPHSGFRPLAWMDPRPFLISPKKFISWLSPILTMFGSTLFAINNASQASKHVSPPLLLHSGRANVRLQSSHVFHAARSHDPPYHGCSCTCVPDIMHWSHFWRLQCMLFL